MSSPHNQHLAPDNHPPPTSSMKEAAAAAAKLLSLTLNPDGSLTRLNQPPTLPANPDPDHDRTALALSKDVPLNPDRNTFIRLFRPALPPPAKLPLIVYFHGGGFIILSAATSFFHQSSSRMAAHVPALVASVEYRLAPEHRLPAAYDDAMDAIEWVKKEAVAADGDPWMKELVDFSRVFLMGSSAGGNIVYHAGLCAVDVDLRPVEIVGLIMNQAFFGGVQRSESELKYDDDPIVPLHVTDMMWSLALPEGADRGHVYCDPSSMAGDERIRRLPPCVVRGYGRDPLVSREKELAQMLEEHGVKVRHQFLEEGSHAAEIFDEEFAAKLYDAVKDFVGSVGGGQPDGIPEKAANFVG